MVNIKKGVQLRNYSHNEVVDVLKECEKGKETIIKLKRRKYSISMPAAKSSNANLNSVGQTNGYSPSTQSNTSNNLNDRKRKFYSSLFFAVRFASVCSLVIIN